MCPVASTHGQKHGAWPAANGQTEWQFNMARLRDVRLPKAVNQEELESGAGDGAQHVKRVSSVRLEGCHQNTLHCVTYCSPIITAERLPGGPGSPSDMNPATNTERRNEVGEEH